MWKLYNETNALKSEAGEQLNVYFLTPVSKKVSPGESAIVFARNMTADIPVPILGLLRLL